MRCLSSDSYKVVGQNGRNVSQKLIQRVVIRTSHDNQLWLVTV